jgi:PAS domain S-box-containing protein
VIWDLVHNPPDSQLRAVLEAAMSARASADVEIASYARPGRWLAMRAFPLEGGLGVSFRDITERRARVRREHEQAERLELALAASGLGDWSWDAGTDLVTFSERAAATFGVPVDPPMTWTDQQAVLHPDDRDRARLAVIEALETRNSYEIEYRVARPSDGEERWIMVRARGQYDERGAPIGMIGVLGDITAVKQDELRVRESEARFRAMADSAPAPVWVTSAAGPVEFVNRAFCELTGKTVEELLGDAWIDLMHPEDAPRVGALRADARRALEPYSWDARYRAADGGWRWMRAAAQPRFDDTGVFQGYVGLAVDVTDARRAEERQRLLINELNHRVKNTLATIQSLAHQTLREGTVTRDARNRLTERLLALSSAHNVLTNQNWESAELRDIARGAVGPYNDPQRPRIQIEGPYVHVSPNVALALSMALHELATNAVKYGALSTPEGRVSVRWTLDEAIHLVWREEGGPPVTPPAAKGFGSRLLAGLTADLGSAAEIQYAADGLVCRLRAPAA